ncbi:hypothetical protein SADO_01840 [Salinisphaera dokdonensis CL-ES53]|uniref:ImmA/IrrE family metallo-endopeptidase n=1 Tax=Salinisphaera dokdonensis CL-ES53 TaxID=1304272 RepID=A0ABV2AXF7_9GAMM
MNTTKKGDRLEDRAFSDIKKQIAEDRFFAKKEYCEIFRKKGYYSRDRKKNIVFDISVEVTLAGEDRYSLLFLFECKNYGHSIPVDDVEEFFSKIQQVSGANCKGIVLSESFYQEGSFEFAKSKGIGLLRYFGDDDREWVLTRSPSSMALAKFGSFDKSSIYQALRDKDYKSKYFDFYGYVGGAYTVSLREFFQSLAKFSASSATLDALSHVEKATTDLKPFVPYLHEGQIEQVALHLLTEVNYETGSVPLNEVCHLFRKRFGLVVEHGSRLETGVLGQISFEPDLVSIDTYQASTPERGRFTLAHELGHFSLRHREFMRRETCHEEDIEIESSGGVELRDIRRLEWQANYFASCLLLPKKQFEEELLKQVSLHGLFDRGYGLLYLDHQPCNIATFCKVTAPLMRLFQVSRSVVKLRLLKLGFLNELVVSKH